VIKFINLIFGLTALQDLPDEAAVQKLGIELFQQANLGPEDDPKTDVGRSNFGLQCKPAEGTQSPAGKLCTDRSNRNHFAAALGYRSAEDSLAHHADR
jgi:hypothetical protein